MLSVNHPVPAAPDRFGRATRDGRINLLDDDDDNDGTPDLEENRALRELRESAQRLFNQFWYGMDAEERKEFLQKSAQEQFDAFSGFIGDKLTSLFESLNADLVGSASGNIDPEEAGSSEMLLAAADHNVAMLLIVAQLSQVNRMGNHWVPGKVVENLGDKIGEGAAKYFKNQSIVPLLYKHGNDTWDGVSHVPGYNDAVQELLEAFIDGYSPSGSMTSDEAERFLNFLLAKKNDPQLEEFFAKKSPNALATAKRWIAGFLNSARVSMAAETLGRELGEELTENERKLITRALTSGSDKNVQSALNQLKRSTRGMRVLNALKEGGEKYLSRFAGPVVALLFMSGSASRGYAGEGRHAELDGLIGAADNALYEAVWADMWEPIVKKQVGRSYKFLADWLNLPDEKPGGRARRKMEALFGGEGLFD